MITIMGASGHTGRTIAENLLRAGEPIRVLGRSQEKLASLVQAGAECAVGDLHDVAFLRRALQGSDAVYTLIPPDYATEDHHAYADRIGTATAQAVRDAKVRKVVLLSSIGAERASGTGPIAALHRQEARLAAIPGIDLLILRPAFFLENHLANIGLIQSQGIHGGAIEPDLPMAMIATVDIGTFAARALVDQDFSGQVVRELLGQRDLTMTEAAHVLGASIGKPDLAYSRFADADYEKALVSAGISADLASQYTEMARAFNAGIVGSLAGRNAANTTPTSIEAWAEAVFEPAYRAA